MQTVWLASYPKCGNTWFRMLVANLFAGGDETADINNLPERGGIASARGPFDHLLLIDSGTLTFDEVDTLRPLVHSELARGADDDVHDEQVRRSPVRFIKTHDSYTLTRDGQPLLGGARGADGAILIVRDPRDVASSLANHNGSSVDDAITFMGDPASSFCGKTDRQQLQLRQQLLGWSGFAESWLAQRDIPVHLLRYEDMRADPESCFAKALAFAGVDAAPDDIARAVRLADFSKLKAMEQENGFREAPRSRTHRNFFRRGEAGAWREELTAEQIARIESDHAATMARFGYHPDS